MTRHRRLAAPPWAEGREDSSGALLSRLHRFLTDIDGLAAPKSAVAITESVFRRVVTGVGHKFSIRPFGGPLSWAPTVTVIPIGMVNIISLDQKKAMPDGPTVSTKSALSRKRFRASQLVSAITRQPWQAAPWRARLSAAVAG